MIPLALAAASVHAGMPEGADPVLVAPLINGREAKEPVLMWREHGNWVADATTWARLGVVLREHEQGALSDLTLGVTVHYDPAAATVSLDIPATRRPFQTLDQLRRTATPRATPAIGGLLLNYDLASQRTGGTQATSAALDLRTGGRWGVLSSTGQINENSDRFEMVRGITTWQKDDLFRQLTYQAGDVFVTSQPTTVAMGGIRIAKDPAALDPLTPTWPVPVLGGVALDPGTVSIVSNQAEVSHSNVQAGAFSVDGRYLAQGANLANVVVRDAYGRETVVNTQSLYVAHSLMRAGLSNWELVAGRIREAENRYGTTGASASGAWGLTNLLTIHSGGQIDAAGHHDATFGATTGLGMLGVLEGEIGASSSGGQRWLALYRYQGPRITIRVQRERNDDFWSLRQEDAAVITARTQASFSFRPITGLSLIASYSEIDTSSSRTQLARLTGSFNLRAFGDLSTSLSRDIDDDDLVISMSYTRHFSSNASAGVTARQAPGEDAYGVRANYRTENGIRLALDSQDGDQGAQSKLTTYARTHWGDARANVYTYDGNTVTAGSFSGALYVDGGGVEFARTVSDSYALVDVAGQEGVTVRLNGAAAGITDAQGRLLLSGISGLVPFTISLDDKQLPLGVELGNTSKKLTAQRDGGARVTFKAKTRNAHSFTLLNHKLAAGTPISTANEQGVVGYDGEIYLEFPEPGQVVNVKGTCRAVLPNPLPDVDTIETVPCR